MKNKLITIEKIRDIVLDCSHLNIEGAYELGNDNRLLRKREYVYARQRTCYFAKSLLPEFTLTQIGAIWNNQGHATVLHSIKTVNNLIDSDKHYAYNIKKINLAIKVYLGKSAIAWEYVNTKIVYARDGIEFGYIQPSKGKYIAWCLLENIGTFNTIDLAMQKVQDKFIEMLEVFSELPTNVKDVKNI